MWILYAILGVNFQSKPSKDLPLMAGLFLVNFYWSMGKPPWFCTFQPRATAQNIKRRYPRTIIPTTRTKPVSRRKCLRRLWVTIHLWEGSDESSDVAKGILQSQRRKIALQNIALSHCQTQHKVLPSMKLSHSRTNNLTRSRLPSFRACRSIDTEFFQPPSISTSWTFGHDIEHLPG